MARMLDVLEIFLNYHGHAYLRLDGATPVQKRQVNKSCNCIASYVHYSACVYTIYLHLKYSNVYTNLSALFIYLVLDGPV